MAMIKCHECNNDISSKAKSCPNCGAKSKRTSAFTWAVAIIAALWLLGHFTADPSSNTAFNATTASNAPEPLRVENYRCDKSYRFLHLRGQVTNITDRPIDQVTAVGQFYGSDGALIKSSDSLVDYQPLLPGQTSPFDVITSDNPEIKNCQVAFKKLLGGQLMHIEKPAPEPRKKKK